MRRRNLKTVQNQTSEQWLLRQPAAAILDEVRFAGHAQGMATPLSDVERMHQNNRITPRFVALLIMDGWGIHPNTTANAVRLARTPNVSALAKAYPYTQIEAHGNC